MRRAAQLGQKPRTSTEGHHQAFRVTAVTAHPQESVLKTAAFQVIRELPARHTLANPCPVPPNGTRKRAAVS